MSTRCFEDRHRAAFYGSNPRISLPTEEFALEETLTTHSEARIEIERVVADDPEQITPYVWVHVDDFAALEAARKDDPTVEEVMMFSETQRYQPIEI